MKNNSINLGSRDEERNKSNREEKKKEEQRRGIFDFHPIPENLHVYENNVELA